MSAVFFAENNSHEGFMHHQVVMVAVAATTETATITTACFTSHRVQYICGEIRANHSKCNKHHSCD